MRIAQGLLIGTVAAAIGVAGLWQLGCDDKPTEPKPPKDYPVYIGDLAGPRLFTYYPRTRRVDSAAIPWEANRGITASADGKRLYLATDSNVVVIDPATRAVLTGLPYRRSWSVVVSPDNRLLSITGDDLFIVRTSDYSVIFSDTDMTENGHFSCDSRTFYCAAGWGPGASGFLYKVDLTESPFPVERRRISPGGLIHVVPSIDEAKLFLYVIYHTWTCGFEVYDVASDSIIFRDILTPGGGEIAMTHDGTCVFYTNPGISGTDPPSPGTFTVFDVAMNQVRDSVSVYDYAPPTSCLCPPFTMAVTPDDRWLVLLGGTGLAQLALSLYDLRKEEFVDYHDFGCQAVLNNPTTQMIR